MMDMLRQTGAGSVPEAHLSVPRQAFSQSRVWSRTEASVSVLLDVRLVAMVSALLRSYNAAAHLYYMLN